MEIPLKGVIQLVFVKILARAEPPSCSPRDTSVDGDTSVPSSNFVYFFCGSGSGDSAFRVFATIRRGWLWMLFSMEGQAGGAEQTTANLTGFSVRLTYLNSTIRLALRHKSPPEAFGNLRLYASGLLPVSV